MSRITLVFIGHNQLIRCDVTARGKARGTWSRPRPVGVELPGLVDAALRAGGRRPGDVYVLATDFWSQKIALSDDATRGLSREEVARSLAFEAESLSGLPALDSEIGYCVTGIAGKNRDYWIVQVPSWVREQIDATVRQTGGRLRGMAHPGGLPHPVNKTAGGKRASRWLRVEAWPGMVIALGVGQDGRLQNEVAHADARGSAWRGAVETLRQSLGAVEVTEQLIDAGIEPPLASEATTLQLSDEGAAASWLSKWAGVLTHGSAPVPVLTPPKRPVGNWVRTAVGVALAAAVAGVCLWDHTRLNKDIEAANHEATSYKAQAATMDAGKARITALEKQVAERRKAGELVNHEVTVIEAIVDSYRTRWPRLLGALARLCPEYATLITFGYDDGKFKVLGTSLNATIVDQMASALATELRGSWFVSPSQKLIKPYSTEDGFIVFSLELDEEIPRKAIPYDEPAPRRAEPSLTQR